MAIYRVDPTASGANDGSSWTDAFTSLSSAISAATADGDQIRIHYTSQINISADTTFAFLANVAIISVDKTNSDAPTPMSTGGWIGHSSTSWTITISGAYRLYFSGITLRVAGSGSKVMTIANSDGTDATYEDCYLWLGTSTSGAIITGSSTSGSNHAVTLRNTTVRFGNAAQSINVRGRLTMESGGVSADGSAPSTLMNFTSINFEGIVIRFADLSWCGAGTLVSSATGGPVSVTFDRCLLGSGYVAMASQTPANLSAAEVYVLDCASGDTHGLYGYHNALGSVVSDTGITFTAGASAGQSWRIETTANASFHTPFRTPWISGYTASTSALTYRFEVLRDGSSTAYTDAEVWSEWAAKVTSGSTRATMYGDRCGLVATPAAQAAGAGLGSWAGESGTAWSGKVDSGGTITPAEAGDISGRICVGAASATVYVHPEPLAA